MLKFTAPVRRDKMITRFPDYNALPTSPLIRSWGDIPPSTGPFENRVGSRVVTTTDANFVTVLDITTPFAVWGPIMAFRNANATGSQAATFRLYINDILVDERAHTWTADGTNRRAICLGWRAPGDPGVDNTFTAGVDLADFVLINWNGLNGVNTARMVPMTCAPNKIRVDMKATAITVSNTFGAAADGYQIAKGSANYWTEQVKSYRSSAVNVNSGGFTTVGTISGTNLQLMGGIILSHAMTNALTYSYRITIDGHVSTNIHTGSSAGGTQTLYMKLTPFGGDDVLFHTAIPTQHTTDLRVADTQLNIPSIVFNTLEVSVRRDSGSGGTNTFRIYTITGKMPAG
jgi:hypothetical protein